MSEDALFGVEETVHLLWDDQLLRSTRQLQEAVHLLPEDAVENSPGCDRLVRTLRVLERELERRQIDPVTLERDVKNAAGMHERTTDEHGGSR